MSDSTSGAVVTVTASYSGVRFDSRLEAQWAAVFDQHRIVWQYHPELYRLGRVHYEPDFWPAGGETFSSFVYPRGNASR